MKMKDKNNKVCTVCKRSLPRTLEYFYSAGASRRGDKLLGICKECKRVKIKKERIKDKEKKACTVCGIVYLRTREFFYSNKGSWDGCASVCIDCRKKQPNKWQIENPQKAKEVAKKANLKRRQTKPDQVSEDQRKWQQTQYENNPIYRVRMVLSQRLYNALKGKQKEETTIELLGCTASECVLWLESLFLEGMSWNNYGKGEGKWNIDHIKPCAYFDLTKKEQRIECFHYTNLQPLWDKENLLKNASVRGYWYSNGNKVKKWSYDLFR
jgi:hypothetical protein